MEPYEYNALIVITPADLTRVLPLLSRTISQLPARRLIFIGSSEVGEILSANPHINADFINENDLLPFDSVHQILMQRLGRTSLQRGITGWYYQQFLKMIYSYVCKDEYYLVWDGDTVPCSPFSMFKTGTNTPYFDMKHEYHEEYFITMERLLTGFHKITKKSFISEHMLIKCDYMKDLINLIESNTEIVGDRFYEKIINGIRYEKVESNSFSEFETYGTYVALTHPEAYMLRDWHSLRFGAFFFIPECMTDADYAWLGKDFHAISFEKESEYIPECAEFFHNEQYRAKLSPRYILEALQEEGVLEANVTECWN